MLAPGLHVANGQAQAKLPPKHGVRNKNFARSVHPLQNLAVVVISAFVSETDSGKKSGCGAFELGVLVDLARQLLCPLDLVPDHPGEAFSAVVAENEPEFQSAESVP